MSTVRYEVEVVVQETVTLYFDLPVRGDEGPTTHAAEAEARAASVTAADDRYAHGDHTVISRGPARRSQ